MPLSSEVTDRAKQPVSFVPRLSFLTVVVGHSQPSVEREGPNRVRWPVSKRYIMSTKLFFLRTSVSRLTYVKKNGLVDTGLDFKAVKMRYLKKRPSSNTCITICVTMHGEDSHPYTHGLVIGQLIFNFFISIPCIIKYMLSLILPLYRFTFSESLLYPDLK